MDSVISRLDQCLKEKVISLKFHRLASDFYQSYLVGTSSAAQEKERQQLFSILLEQVIKNIQTPYSFSVFHQAVRHPFDYYQFGLDFIRPFIDFSRSYMRGLENLSLIQSQLKKGENVVFLANHQTEPDPQIISLLLEKTDPQLSSKMIFVAGHRVISDPMAIPMSLGRNLLCIYSKKHMAYPPEEKANKIAHNQRTLKQMQELLNEGGKCIYVAPSGGRDRLNSTGDVSIAPFDPQSVELFWLLGKQAKHLTHFYPLHLETYHLMPPPQHVEKDLGEKRIIHYTPVSITFGKELDMENFPGSEQCDKREKRKKRAEYAWEQVRLKRS